MKFISNITNWITAFLKDDSNFKHTRNILIFSIAIASISMAAFAIMGTSDIILTKILFTLIAGFGAVACVTSVIYSIMYTLRTKKHERVRKNRR